MQKVSLTIILLCSLTISAFAQKEAPCSTAEYQMMDFWVGNWNLTWANGKKGTNVVSKTLNGCVVRENFNGNPGVPGYLGESISAYDKNSKKWKQVWVDNTGGFLDFVGSKEGEEIHFTRKIRKEGKDILQRMRFHNISFRDFDWNWESSENNGQTWKINWAIHYERSSKSAVSKAE